MAGTIFVILFVLWIVAQCSTPTVETQTPNQAVNGAPPADSAPIPTTNWRYSNYRDDMKNRTVMTASLESQNEVEFKFPYAGAQRMTMTLRKNGSAEVLLQIQKGQLICQSYDSCSVSARFGEGPAERFNVSLPTDHSTTTFFVENASRFIAKLQKSHIVRIETVVYQEGSQVFTFSPDGLQWK